MQTRTLTVAMAAAMLASLSAAHADVKVVQSVKVDNPQFQAALQSMSPQQKAQMQRMGIGGTVQSTIYISGQKFRTDVGQVTSVLVNKSAGTVTTINRLSHTYSQQPFKNATGAAKANVRPTGKTRTILGHLCREYRVSASSAQGGTITGDIWAAPDLPSLPVSALGTGPGAAIQGQLGRVGGMPLLTTVMITGSPLGNTTVTSRATAISSTPLPAATFTVPAGYTPGPAGLPGGGGGFPMGGGAGQ